jgi:flagellar biosynthesis/type III secretory pathway protein FliH
MSSSDRRGLARGAVLGPDALAAFGFAAGGTAGVAASGAAAWQPLDLADARQATSPGAATTQHAFDALDAFAPFDVETADGAFAGAAGAAWSDEGGFADALPDFLCDDVDDVAPGLSPELSLARERALRDELTRDFEAQLAEMAAQHEQQLADTYAAGVEQGQAEGATAAERMLADAMAALEAALTQLHAHEDRWLSHLQENVAVLAVGVARHVIGREIAADDTLVQARVAAAMAEYPLHEALTLRVHPDDLALLKMAFDLEHARDARTLRWTADDRVARGGCLVEGRERIVDGRVDTALERVYRQLSGQHA